MNNPLDVLHMTPKEVKYVNDICDSMKGKCIDCPINKAIGWCPMMNFSFCGNNICRENLEEFRKKVVIR